jgi:hypothetical protein
LRRPLSVRVALAAAAPGWSSAARRCWRPLADRPARWALLGVAWFAATAAWPRSAQNDQPGRRCVKLRRVLVVAVAAGCGASRRATQRAEYRRRSSRQRRLRPDDAHGWMGTYTTATRGRNFPFDAAIGFAGQLRRHNAVPGSAKGDQVVPAPLPRSHSSTGRTTNGRRTRASGSACEAGRTLDHSRIDVGPDRICRPGQRDGVAFTLPSIMPALAARLFNGPAGAMPQFSVSGRQLLVRCLCRRRRRPVAQRLKGNCADPNDHWPS